SISKGESGRPTSCPNKINIEPDSSGSRSFFCSLLISLYNFSHNKFKLYDSLILLYSLFSSEIVKIFFCIKFLKYQHTFLRSKLNIEPFHLVLENCYLHACNGILEVSQLILFHLNQCFYNF